jgi:hypothetical protein
MSKKEKNSTAVDKDQGKSKFSGFEVQIISDKDREKLEAQKVRLTEADYELSAKVDVLSKERQELHKKISQVNDQLNVEDSLLEVSHYFDCFPDEGAYAIYCAVKNIFGDVDLRPEKTPSGKNPPVLKNIKLPSGDYLKVPWGNIQLPVFSENSHIEIQYDPDEERLRMYGRIARKNIKAVDEVAKETQKLLNEDSIYKGQAIKIDFDHIEEGGMPNEPEFMDLKNINEESVILSDKARSELVPIFVRIENTENCIKNKLDLKYGALMEGPYGTGKTLIAFLTAKKAIENGWTFMYLKNCKQTEHALRLAERFSNSSDSKGVILFAEDIDQAIRGERDDKMQGILNTLDGGDTKGIPIISIFTTNHLELIEPTILRGKRIGSIITLEGLDEKTSRQFLRIAAVDSKGNRLINNSEIETCYKSLIGIVPAFVAEIIDRAKSYMVANGRTELTGSDIISAANSYKKQQELSALKPKDNPNEILGKLTKKLAHYLMDSRLLKVDNPEIKE